MDWKLITKYPDDALREAWEEFLADASYPTHYTAPNFFTDPYIRGERFAVLAFEGEKIAAVLTGVDNGGQDSFRVAGPAADRVSQRMRPLQRRCKPCSKECWNTGADRSN